MSTVNIVNDLLNVQTLSQVVVSSRDRVPVAVGNADLNLNTLGLTNSNMYYTVTPSAARTITLPVNYSSYKGRVLHFLNYSSAAVAVTVPTVSTSSGAVYSQSATTASNASTAYTLFAPSTQGYWVSMVCDGSTGWLIFASGN